MTVEELRTMLQKGISPTHQQLNAFMEVYNLAGGYMEDLLGIKSVTLYKWLSGEKPPSIQRLWGLIAKFPPTLKPAQPNPKIAKVRWVYPNGDEIRYARSIYSRWPGCEEALGSQGYWYGRKEAYEFLGKVKILDPLSLWECRAPPNGFRCNCED